MYEGTADGSPYDPKRISLSLPSKAIASCPVA